MATTKKKRPVNYLNNNNLRPQIKLSQERYRGSNQPDKTTASCMTPELVKMLMTLVNRYASRSNWRNYTYLDDMKSEALISLLTGALKYDEKTSPNAFGYLTQFIYHSFLTTLEKEKKVRDIRDDILEENGLDPSYTRQLANDESFLRKREVAFYREELGQEPPVLFNPRRRGRKKKIQVENEKAHEQENPPE